MNSREDDTTRQHNSARVSHSRLRQESPNLHRIEVLEHPERLEGKGDRTIRQVVSDANLHRDLEAGAGVGHDTNM